MRKDSKVIVKNADGLSSHVQYLVGQTVVIDRLHTKDKIAYVKYGGAIYSLPIDSLQEIQKKEKDKRPRGAVVSNPTELNDAEVQALKDAGDLIFYMVVNHEGKFFRAKGVHGYGASWVSEVKRGRVYSKVGPARACVTYFATYNKNNYPIPKILEIGSNIRRFVF